MIQPIQPLLLPLALRQEQPRRGRGSDGGQEGVLGNPQGDGLRTLYHSFASEFHLTLSRKKYLSIGSMKILS